MDMISIEFSIIFSLYEERIMGMSYNGDVV
jgi:hypothetical protein